MRADEGPSAAAGSDGHVRYLNSHRRRLLPGWEDAISTGTPPGREIAAVRAGRTGLFTGPHTGVALAALTKMAQKKLILKGDKVLVISTADRAVMEALDRARA